MKLIKGIKSFISFLILTTGIILAIIPALLILLGLLLEMNFNVNMLISIYNQYKLNKNK